MPSLAPFDYAIVAVYLTASLVVGLAMCRRAGDNSRSYFLGDRIMPWWINGVSLAATSLAADTPLVVTELVRGRGLQRLWWLFASTITLIVGVFLFSRLWRRLDAMTDAEFCELRYDGRAAAILRATRAFMSGIVANLLTIGWITLGMASVLAVMMPINQWIAVSVAMSLTLSYTMLGGFLSAVVTDLFQFAVTVITMVILAVVAVHSYGGIARVLAAVAVAPGYGERTLTMIPDFSGRGLDLACFIIILSLWWGDAGGYVMQRLSACRNERDAVKAMLFFAVFQSVRPWIWAVVALVSIAVYPVLPPGHTDTQAYPLVLTRYLATGMKGLLLAAFAGAFMSTIASQLNWGASYLMKDLYCRFLRPNAGGREFVLVSRGFTLLLAIAGMAIVPLLASVTQAWEFLALMTAGSGVFGVVRWFWWRCNAWTELSAIGLGLLCAIANLLLVRNAPDLAVFGTSWSQLRFEIKLALFTVFVVPASLAATFLGSPVNQAQLEAFYRKVRPGGWWGGVSAEARALPDHALSRNALLGLLWGLLVCGGSTVAVGYAILQRPAPAVAGVIVGVLGATGFRTWFRRENLSTLNRHAAAAPARPPAER